MSKVAQQLKLKALVEAIDRRAEAQVFIRGMDEWTFVYGVEHPPGYDAVVMLQFITGGWMVVDPADIIAVGSMSKPFTSRKSHPTSNRRGRNVSSSQGDEA